MHKKFGLLHYPNANKYFLYLWSENIVGLYLLCFPPYSPVAVYCLSYFLGSGGCFPYFFFPLYLEEEKPIGKQIGIIGKSSINVKFLLFFIVFKRKKRRGLSVCI